MWPADERRAFLPQTRTDVIVLHSLRADAADVKFAGVLWMRHDMDVTDFLCLAHLPRRGGHFEILDPGAAPVSMRHTVVV